MPSFQDSAVIFLLALLLFGPKKLPELARYIGKLMGEFRRASSEFRLQMEDEFRLSEQAEQQKKIAAIEAAAPVAPPLNIPEPEHPHLDSYPVAEAEPVAAAAEPAEPALEHHIDARPSTPPVEPVPAPVPIASSGDLNMMPPSTGLPVPRMSISSMFQSIPKAPAAEPAAVPEPEAHSNA